MYPIVYGFTTGSATGANPFPQLAENATPFSQVQRAEVDERLARR